MSWEEYGRLEAVLVDNVKKAIAEKHEKIAMVFGIFRGGIILARSMVSRLGEIPLGILHPKQTAIGKLACMADDDMNKLSEAKKKSMMVLLVDDISDTGMTFGAMKQCLCAHRFSKVYTAALVVKPKSAFIPDFYAQEDPTDAWIVFPWEIGG